jgi:hypothetical protein
LNWVADLAALVSAEPGIDWDAVHYRARQLRSVRRVQLGMALGSDLLGMRVEGSRPFSLAGASAVSGLVPVVKERLLVGPEIRTIDNFVTDFRFHFFAADAPLGSLGILQYYCHKITRADKEAMMLPMSKGISVMYQMFRAIRGALKR